MMASNKLITRRSFLCAAAVTGAMFLDSPLAFGEELTGGVVVASGRVEAYPGLTLEEIDVLAREQARKQAEAEIAQAIASAGLSRAGREKYETVYGPTVQANTGWKWCSNQPSEGIRIRTGGSLQVDLRGGPSVSISVSFGGPYGSIALNFETGKQGVGSVLINIKSDGFYKARVINSYRCVPYITYAIDMAGNKRVFARGASKTWKDADYDAVKIK